MVDLIEKDDLYSFETRLMAFMEQLIAEPMKQWFSRDDLAKLRHCSASELYKNPELLPNNGVPEDRWGRTMLWSRETVKDWLLQTRQELRDQADSRTPEEIERAEFLRQAGAYRNGNITLVK